MSAISLGWNCSTTMKGVELGIRDSRKNGYLTCPFDLANTNYLGILFCLKEDFMYFCDPNYIILKEFPITDKYYPGEKLIYNTRYNFIFNHESPGHANLYISENWEHGINHFIENNFQRFIERYSRRISNFRKYITSQKEVVFMITYPNSIEELQTILKTKCSCKILQFNIENAEKYNDHMKIMQVL
jgi:hypothetical protein